MRKIIRKAKEIIKHNLAEFMDRLLLLLFGIGLGVKIIVVNHDLDPRNLNLDLMIADYVLILAAPFFLMLLTKVLNRLTSPDDLEDDNQKRLNQILVDVTDPPA